MNENVAIIFKKELIDNETFFVPIKFVIGTYDENSKTFKDENDCIYFHNSSFKITNTFGLRKNILDLYSEGMNLSDYFKKYKNCKFSLITIRNKFEFICIDEKNQASICEDCDINVSHLNEDTNETNNMFIDDYKNNNIHYNLRFDTKKIKEELKKIIKAQDAAIDTIVTTIWRNIKDNNLQSAKNILINGSTGVGKTEIFKQINKLTKIPLIITDANTYTMEGYVGKSVEYMLELLLEETNGNIEAAEHGIIFIDEFDKLGTDDINSSKVVTTGVQYALLKMIEGADFQIKYKNELKKINTSKITFVLAGSFFEVEKNNKNVIGFNSVDYEKSSTISDEKLIKHGFEPEILGRLPVRITLKTLTINDLICILKDSKISSLNEEIQFLKSLGIDTKYDDHFIEYIAREAYLKGGGARGLTRIIDDIFNNVMIEISENHSKYKQLIIEEPDETHKERKYRLI